MTLILILLIFGFVFGYVCGISDKVNNNMNEFIRVNKKHHHICKATDCFLIANIITAIVLILVMLSFLLESQDFIIAAVLLSVCSGAFYLLTLFHMVIGRKYEK